MMMMMMMVVVVVMVMVMVRRRRKMAPLGVVAPRERSFLVGAVWPSRLHVFSLHSLARHEVPAWFHQTGTWSLPPSLQHPARVHRDVTAFLDGGAAPLLIDFGNYGPAIVPDADARSAFTVALYRTLSTTGHRAGSCRC